MSSYAILQELHNLRTAPDFSITLDETGQVAHLTLGQSVAQALMPVVQPFVPEADGMREHFLQDVSRTVEPEPQITADQAFPSSVGQEFDEGSAPEPRVEVSIPAGSLPQLQHETKALIGGILVANGVDGMLKLADSIRLRQLAHVVNTIGMHNGRSE